MVKYIIVTQNDPFYLPEFFREFRSLIKDDNELVIQGILIQKALGDTKFLKSLRMLYVIYGPLGLFRKGMEYVFKKCLDIVAVKIFRGKLPGIFSIRHFALQNGWNIIQTEDINSELFLSFIRENQTDLVVAVGSRQIFGEEVLKAPTYGCINIHNSRLPKLRGLMPTFWALMEYEKDPTSATTIYKMNENLGAGDIILQDDFQLDPEESVETHIQESKVQGAHLIYTALRLYLNGEPVLHPNPHTEATYRTIPGSEDVKEFRKKGYKIL